MSVASTCKIFPSLTHLILKSVPFNFLEQRTRGAFTLKCVMASKQYQIKKRNTFRLGVCFLTHERGRRDRLPRRRRVRGSGLQEGYVGGKKQLAATVLTEENRQKNTGRAALIEG